MQIIGVTNDLTISLHRGLLRDAARWIRIGHAPKSAAALPERPRSTWEKLRLFEFVRPDVVTAHICHAAETGDTKRLTRWRTHPFADPNAVASSSGATPLWHAATHGHTATVKVLKQSGRIDLNKGKVDKGRTPLHDAAKLGHYDVVETLLLASVRLVNARDNGKGTALMLAAKNKHHRVADLLLEHGADPDATDALGRTALAHAVLENDVKMVEVLRDRSAGHTSRDIRDEQGKIPLDYAKAQGNPAMIAALTSIELLHWRDAPSIFDACLRSMIRSNDLDALLDVLNNPTLPLAPRSLAVTAAALGRHEILEALIQHPTFDVNATDDQGRTALIAAAERGDLFAIRRLLRCKGIHLHLQDRQGRTALMHAVLSPPRSILNTDGTPSTEVPTFRAERVLAERSDDITVNATDHDGWTALMHAANSGDAGVIRSVLGARGVQLNLKNDQGDTELMLAVHSGNAEAVRTLLEAPDIDPNIPDKDGYTPLMRAAAMGRHQEMIDHLVADPRVNLSHQVGDWNALRLAVFAGLDVRELEDAMLDELALDTWDRDEDPLRALNRWHRGWNHPLDRARMEVSVRRWKLQHPDADLSVATDRGRRDQRDPPTRAHTA